MSSNDVIFLPSVLDRLLDESPDSAAGRPGSRAGHLAQLRNSIRRDLEALLNTHRCCRPMSGGMTELDQSLLCYGVPDFLSVNAGSAAAREEFRLSVEEIIKRFEPRFKNVAVMLVDDEIQMERVLRFRIDALMYAEPAPERVSFDSVLDPSNHSFSVIGAGND